MTRERIKDFKEIVLPFFTNYLLKKNYENLGKSDAEEFEKDFSEIIELADKALEQQPCEDTISRQAAIDALTALEEPAPTARHLSAIYDCEDAIKALPSAQPEQRWIPFKTRPLTKAEKEEHPEWDGILDCKLPDDGQRILVNVSVRGHESVQYDEFYTDDGSYLDSGYEIGTEATAWMPLPEPYDAESEDKE